MLTPQQAIAEIARGAADRPPYYPKCPRCKGLGTLGTVKLTYRPNYVLICPCAAKGFPRLSKSPYLRIQPSDEEALAALAAHDPPLG